MSNIKLKQSAGSGTVTLKAAASGSNDVELTLPNDIGSNDQYLKLSGVSGKTGTLSFATVGGGDVVDDTTPQLGGDLDTNGKNIKFGDSSSHGASGDDTLIFGADDDLRIYHDGSDAKISNNTGAFVIQDSHAGANAIIVRKGAEVELLHNNVLACETSANGLAFPSGKGIDFSATANTSATGASMSSELFEDYEEGSWTPTLAEGSASYSKCKYVRIGNMCYLNFDCDNVTDRTSSTDWRIAAASLPFGPNTDFTDNMVMGVVAHRYTSHADNATIYASMNGSGVGWYSANDTEGDDAFSAFKHSHVDQTYSAFHFSGWYYV